MRVPTYTPAAQESAAPVVQQNPNVSSAAFGAPIAQGMANATNAFVQYQDDADNLRVQEAYNQLRERQLDLEIGEKTGYANVKGRDVMAPRADGRALSDDYLAQFDTIGREIEGSLANDRQRQKFRQRFGESALSFRAGLVKHENAQIAEYAKTVTNATVALESEAAVKHWNSPDLVSRSIENIRGAVQAQGLRDGLPADAIKVIEAAKVSDVHYGVIASAADAGNLDYAREQYTQNEYSLTTDARAKLKKILDEGDFEVRTQTGAEQAWEASGGDAAKALEIARTKYKGKEEDAIVTRIKGFDSERVTLRERGQKDAADQGWQMASQGKAPPASLYAAMDGRDAAAIRRHLAEGPTRKTSIAKWLEFTNKRPEELAAMAPHELLREYGQHFSDGDIRNANEMILAARGKPSKEGLQLMTTTDLVKRSARELGILPEHNKPSPEEEAAFDTFRNTMQTKVNAWEAANGKKATPEVLNELLREEKLNKVKLDVWGSDPERAVVALGDDDIKKAYVEVGGKTIKLSSIPTDYRQNAIRRIQARGLMVTESLIAQMWAADQSNK